MPSDEAHEIQRRLEANRERAGLTSRGRSMSSVEAKAFDVTTACRDCGTELTVVHLHVRDPERSEDDPGAWTPAPMLPVLCAVCEKSDPLDRVTSRHAPRKSVADWLDARGVNTAMLGHATLENFDPVHAPRALEAARLFVDEVAAAGKHDRVRGLYLYGEGKGNGKSHLAVAIMRAVHGLRPDLSVFFEPADRLIVRVQDSYNGEGRTDELIEARARAGLYVLDDLGREKATADALRVLATIFDERAGRPTAITSNGLPADLGARHGFPDEWGRIESRLGDAVYRFLEVSGPDRRFQAQGSAA